jgi:membrane associated rhomboid family serine protease
MATLTSCHATTRPRVVTFARRRVSRVAAPRRAPARRRLAATGRDDGSPNRDEKKGTLSALDSILGGTSGAQGEPKPRTTTDMNEMYLEKENTEADEVSDVRPDEPSSLENYPPPEGWPIWFSPLSPVYDVPTVAPKAAYLIALVHAFVFLSDYFLYKTGAGNGGDLFLQLAAVDDALINGGQWLRPWSAAFVDYGVVQFATSTLALVTIGAEIEALFGSAVFATIYICSSTAGVLSVTAFDANTHLTVGGSNAIFGIFGAIAAYSAVNAEPEWNPNGVAYRALQMIAFGTALGWIAGLPTLGNEHVVSNFGHSTAFTVGAAMAYFGGAPLWVSLDGEKIEKRARVDALRPGENKNPSSSLLKLPLTDILGDEKDKTYIGLGVASGLLAAESVLVLVRRMMDSQ